MRAETHRESIGPWLALLTAGLLWAAGLGRMLLHRVVVSNDSLSNYAHVWYLSDRIWGGHGIPFRFPALSHGDGLALPYGTVPWLSAALARPLFGDWTVTLWHVAGIIGLIAATFFALPEVRRPAAAALVLLNPFLVEAALLFQMPFTWAAALLFVAAGLFRRGAYAWAALLGGLAQASHAPVAMPIAGLLAAGWFIARPEERRPLVFVYFASVVLALPAAWIALIGPTVQGSTAVELVSGFVGTVALRLLVFAAPIAIALRPPRTQQAAALGLALFAAANVALVPLRHDGFAWGSLLREPDATVEQFTLAPEFRPGAAYRILRVGDGKVGMDQLLRAGARLDSEFFPESIDRRSWASGREYAAFLTAREVDDVMLFDNYTARYRTNEAALLEQLSSAGCAELTVARDGFRVYSLALTAECLAGGITP